MFRCIQSLSRFAADPTYSRTLRNNRESPLSRSIACHANQLYYTPFIMLFQKATIMFPGTQKKRDPTGSHPIYAKHYLFLSATGRFIHSSIHRQRERKERSFASVGTSHQSSVEGNEKKKSKKVKLRISSCDSDKDASGGGRGEAA